MTTDAPPPTRRGLRTQTTGGQPIVDETPAGDLAAPDRAAGDDHVVAVAAEAADGAPAAGAVVASGAVGAATLVVEQSVDADASPARPLALVWLDDDRLARTAAPASDADAAPAASLSDADLLARAPRRTPWRPGVLVPAALLALVAGLYAAVTLLWPLHAVAPEIEAATVQTEAAPAAALTWPAEGSAAISIAGVEGALATTGDSSSMASITKVVTALLVLDRLPLAVGESGPEYAFTAADRAQYWLDRANGESALDVPVGGTLTEYQLLEGMLIGSANNYADRLARDLWPSDAVFADAANEWLEAHGVSGVVIADPSGIEEDNTATPEGLLTLAERAMAHPVIAEIVGRTNVQLPGAGNVENTNELLADAGVVGIKTGTLDAYNLLSAKDIVVGDTTVRAYAAVLGQPDDATRNAVSRDLFAQLEQELQLRPSVTADTVVGRVVTEWGESVEVVTAGDASVVLWNGASATTASEFALGDADDAGDVVGELTVAGPLDRVQVDLELTDDVEGPSAWWRLTHPLDLFGLN